MTRHTILFVAGSSPQIITETVAALCNGGVGVGDVHILTTETGRRRIEDRLFGTDPHWRKLVARYPKARRSRFSKRNIVVLRDAAGAALEDVRTQADNLAAADQITSFVAGLTGPESPPLHASIAGGRKTMGYLLAAAMMLYGRRDDRMSHVLVHPSVLEGSDFYFPPKSRRGRLRYRRDDGTFGSVLASEVRVELADLPFPRLRAVTAMRHIGSRSFSDLVSDLQAVLEATARPHVSIRVADGVLLCSERRVRLSPLQVAIYAELAARRKAGCGNSACAGCSQCFLAASEITSGTFRDLLRARLKERSSTAVDVRGGGKVWSAENFRPERRKINEKIDRVLREAGEPFHIHAIGGRGERHYGLALPVDQIEFL